MIWQEYECPRTGIDFDLNELEIVFRGAAWHCAGCGGNHVAGGDVSPTTLHRQESGDLVVHDLPETAEDVARLLEIFRK